jgi:Kdo2-lipid IVA lauroyltransferase/acyltransferase
MKSAQVKKFRRKIRYSVVLGLVRFTIFISKYIPRKVWISVFGFLGGLSYYFAATSRKLTVKHLTIAFEKEKTPEEIKKLSREVFVMLGKNAGDVIRAFNTVDVKAYKKLRVVHGEEYAEEAYSRGKGVIFLTAHCGAFEFAATEMALRGYKPLIIGTPLKDTRLSEIVWKQRSKLGAVAIARGKESIRLLKTLKSGGTIGILIDQDTRVKSVFVDFFGKPCATPIGATLLSLKTGAPIVPIFFHMRKDNVQEVNFYPEVEMIRTGDEKEDIRRNTQKLNDLIEAEIRKHPAQWVWMHERWKTRPEEIEEKD